MRPRVVRTSEAAAYVGLARHTLENLRSSGGGPRCFKLDRVVRYNLAALDQWLEDHRDEPSALAAPSSRVIVDAERANDRRVEGQIHNINDASALREGRAALESQDSLF